MASPYEALAKYGAATGSAVYLRYAEFDELNSPSNLFLIIILPDLVFKYLSNL
jgi:hypothetical protein